MSSTALGGGILEYISYTALGGGILEYNKFCNLSVGGQSFLCGSGVQEGGGFNPCVRWLFCWIEVFKGGSNLKVGSASHHLSGQYPIREPL